MNIDEANRRSKFHETAEHQEGKIKDFVLSLDIISTLTSTAHPSSIAAPLHGLIKNNSTKSPKSQEKSATKLTKIADGIECCEVKIDYWFQEDIWQQLFGQLLLIILITSRWLITRSGLTVNQRSLILVISVATAADTLNFFCYLNLEIVYRNKYLLYSALLIISLSLLQFVFLHVEDSLNVIGKNNNYNQNKITNNANNNNNNNMNSNNIYSNNINSSTSQLDETVNEEYRDNAIMNTGNNKYPLFFKKYPYMKQPVYGGGVGSTPNGQPQFNSTLASIVCCCFEQQDPLFFILLAGLFLHDGSYLTFRIFIVSKLGWTQTNDLDPTFSFFLIKNIIIIVTQVYKVYCVTRDRRNRRYYDEYRTLMMANQQNQHTTNPYRFAQLYTDVGSPLASKTPLFKSMTTLGSNQIYFENSPNLYKPALPPVLFSQPQGHSLMQQQQHQQQQQQQQQTPSITESVLAVMAQDYSIQRQLQNNEQAYYHAAMSPALSTPLNPFTSKVGKALYGLPFLSRSKASMNTANFLAGNNGAALKTQYQGGQATNPMTAGACSKLLKSSKI